MLSMSDPIDISLVLAVIGFQWLHIAASNYQSMFMYVCMYFIDLKIRPE